MTGSSAPRRAAARCAVIRWFKNTRKTATVPVLMPYAWVQVPSIERMRSFRALCASRHFPRSLCCELGAGGGGPTRGLWGLPDAFPAHVRRAVLTACGARAPLVSYYKPCYIN